MIMAIGQVAELNFLTPEDGINVTRRGLIEADTETFQTSRPDVFAGGDFLQARVAVILVLHGVSLSVALIETTPSTVGFFPDEEVEGFLRSAPNSNLLPLEHLVACGQCTGCHGAGR